MDVEELKEEIEHQRVLQKEYRKRLRVLEQQAAKFGIYVPPHIQIEIDEMNEKIQNSEHSAIRNCKLIFLLLFKKLFDVMITVLRSRVNNPEQGSVQEINPTGIDDVIKFIESADQYLSAYFENFESDYEDWINELKDLMPDITESQEGYKKGLSILENNMYILQRKIAQTTKD